ncbi:hypothetical protein SERLA73DRAFT_172053 [Serpula lacrymans var. lacrymans S7.3]|uniref:Uncharacterized protein n=1 Tax=Serpula lacrymans var. lacrymans (strain S7.3) TaxID=936435 RepID=F8QDU6_SERL3|nr:hypothetical protein SERLA73DRAFT_172053 [Serpula lacrymans var. lacrymans S7.3]
MFEVSRVLILALLLLSLLCQTAIANTEIINFIASDENGAELPAYNWPLLHYAQNEGQWSVQPAPLNTPLNEVCEPAYSSLGQAPFSCPHELWVTLQLDDEGWRYYSYFTLRLSWPASTPADFSIQIYSPESLLSRQSYTESSRSLTDDHNDTTSIRSPHKSSAGSTTTRQKYARIRLTDTGVLSPSTYLSRSGGLPPPVGDPISFILILEPLYMGVLPASVLPVLLFLVPVLVATALAVPFNSRYLEKHVSRARVEVDEYRNTKNE